MSMSSYCYPPFRVVLHAHATQSVLATYLFANSAPCQNIMWTKQSTPSPSRHPGLLLDPPHRPTLYVFLKACLPSPAR